MRNKVHQPPFGRVVKLTLTVGQRDPRQTFRPRVVHSERHKRDGHKSNCVYFRIYTCVLGDMAETKTRLFENARELQRILHHKSVFGLGRK